MSISAERSSATLRDGTTAQVRMARPEDLPELRAFFERLSAESRRRRFFFRGFSAFVFRQAEERRHRLADARSLVLFFQL